MTAIIAIGATLSMVVLILVYIYAGTRPRQRLGEHDRALRERINAEGWLP